jgi:hypothetical protein
MRLAVIVFGRLNKCADHFDNILDSIGNHNEIDFFLSSDNSDENLLNDFIRLYKPILYNNTPVVYDYDLESYPGKRPETNIHTMTCHFINKNRVFALLEEHINKTNIHYDVVISMRIDLVFHDKFDFNNISDNTVYIPTGNDHVINGLNDQLAYGTISTMKKYNSINPKELLDNGLSIPHPESLNYANIHYNCLSIERINLQYYIDK